MNSFKLLCSEWKVHILNSGNAPGWSTVKKKKLREKVFHSLAGEGAFTLAENKSESEYFLSSLLWHNISQYAPESDVTLAWLLLNVRDPKWDKYLITVRQRSCGKVMFSVMSVCSWVGGPMTHDPRTPAHNGSHCAWTPYSASDIWLPSLEICSNLFTSGPTSPLVLTFGGYWNMYSQC